MYVLSKVINIQLVHFPNVFRFCLVLEKYNLHLKMVISGVVLCYFFFFGMKLLYLLKFLRFVVINPHWCTVQWGVVVYHEERNNMQICYGVCFIFK